MINVENRPRIAITMGDPAGIGPEITLRALCDPGIRAIARPIVYGDCLWLINVAKKLDLPVVIQPFVTFGSSLDAQDDAEHVVRVHQTRGVRIDNVTPGTLSAAAGEAAVEWVLTAARAALSGLVDAIVTAPLNKEAIALAGRHYAGHTEILAQAANIERYGMLLITGALRVVHVSTHVSLREAIQRVKAPRILDCIRLGNQACRDLGIESPHIAIAGLNPHAGEGGLFGAEEVDHIRPAIDEAVAEGIDASGPFPPDTIFARAVKGEFDLVVAMYHDQGHIPVKLHGFDTGVNVTIGLPIIRTSVDHGTAFDIAGKGTAREDSMKEAIRVAVRMAHSRALRRP